VAWFRNAALHASVRDVASRFGVGVHALLTFIARIPQRKNTVDLYRSIAAENQDQRYPAMVLDASKAATAQEAAWFRAQIGTGRLSEYAKLIGTNREKLSRFVARLPMRPAQLAFMREVLARGREKAG
jgi:hypothetical protein